MGLDMYLYHVQTDSSLRQLENKVISDEQRDSLEEAGCRFFDMDSTLAKPITKNGTRVFIRKYFYNKAKILSSFGFDDSYTLSIARQSPESVVFKVFDAHDDTKEIEILQSDIKKYLFSQVSVQLAVIMEHIDYQRKGLNDDGWDLLPENCEFSDDKDTVKKMTEIGGLSQSFIDNWIDDETLFMAWW